MIYDLDTAQERLEELVDAALAGEEVVIARDGRPVARLAAMPRARFRFGILEGKVGTPPDFLAPVPEEELDAWGGTDEPPRAS